MEVPVYIYFPIVIALSHYMFKYLRFHSKSIRILKTHYFNEVISSERNDRARIFGALQKLEKEGRIKKIIERNSVFSFVDNLFFTRSNIYYVPINENKLYFRGLQIIYRINKKSRGKVINELRNCFSYKNEG